MDNIYSYEELLKVLQKDKDYYETYLEALNKVEIKRKKDGQHFVNQNQTFVNGKVVIPSYMDSYHPVFKVYGQSKMQGYLDFSFDCYVYVDNLKDDDERKQKAKKANSWSRETYVLSTDEIIQKLEEQKIFCKKRIENYNQQIKSSKKIFEKVNKKLCDLRKCIADSCYILREDEKFPSSIEYALKDYIKYRI